jgi:pilus assembly protein Flp/PilA
MAHCLLYLRHAQSGLGHQFTGVKKTMNNTMLKLYIMIQNLISQDEGQDLVEYALIVALLSLAAVAGMKGLATGINGAFTNITSTLNTATA